MMKVISLLNLKGGVAKTFTAVNMAYELSRRGYRVLLMDNDKQGNLSRAYGRYDAESIAPITRLLSGDWASPEEVIQRTEYEGIDIIAANMSLFGAAWNLTKEEDNYALEGLDIVAGQIEDVRGINPGIRLAGVLITSYQDTDGESAGVEWLEGQGVYDILGIVRYSKKVAENSFLQKPIYEHSPRCGAAQGYKKFVTAYTGKAR